MACVHVSCGPRGRCAVNPWGGRREASVAWGGVQPVWLLLRHTVCAPRRRGVRGCICCAPACLLFLHCCVYLEFSVSSASDKDAGSAELRVRRGRGQRLSDAEATENSSSAALPASLQIGVPTSHPCLWRDNEPAACTRGSSARRLRAHDHAATTPCDGAPRALSGGEAVLAACVRSGQRQRQASQIMLSC